MSHRDISTVKRGVDLEQLGEFGENAAANPDDVQFELSACGIEEGRPAHTTATVESYTLGGDEIGRETRHHEFTMGLWGAFEEGLGFLEPADRAEPIEVALAALTGCINATIGLHALGAGIDIDDIRTTVRTDFDPSVSLQVKEIDEVGSMYEDFQVEVEVVGEGLHEEDRKFMAEVLPLSGTYNLLSRAWDIEPNVTIDSEESR